MRRHDLPDGSTIDLDQVLQIGKLFVNKNYPEFNSYEIYLTNGTSYGVFEKDLKRSDFITTWSA